MTRQWTIGQQLALGFVLPLLAMLTLGAASYRNTQRLLDTSHQVADTHEVMSSLFGVLSTFQDIETGQRGFIITGKKDFLAPYEEGLKNIVHLTDELRRRTANNPAQRARLDRLVNVIDKRIAFAQYTIDTRTKDGLEAAAQILIEGTGKRLTDQIRAIVAEMRAEEEAALDQQAKDAAAASQSLTLVLVGGTVGTLIVVLFAAFAITRSVSRRVGVAVHQIQSSAAEFEAAATQQARGAKGQAVTTAEVEATMRELVSTSRQIAESAQQVMRVAGETAQAAHAGENTVGGAMEMIEAVKRHVDRIVSHMLTLGRKSQQIGGVVDIINELAEQTNILAINATIEAAGAGESGRRFAVVADEIRKLADRVASSAKDVRGLIEEIRGAANTTVMATEEGSKVVEASARQFGEVNASFRRIAEYVANTAQASREIELSTRQQTTAVEQVSAAIGDVAQTARETEVSSGQALQTASALASLSHQLTQLVERRAAAA